MAAMSDDRKERGWASAALVTAILVLLPVLYVLSAGPAEIMLEHDCLSPEFCLAFYWPIAKVCEWSPLIDDAFSWYVMQWTATS